MHSNCFTLLSLKWADRNRWGAEIKAREQLDNDLLTKAHDTSEAIEAREARENMIDITDRYYYYSSRLVIKFILSIFMLLVEFFFFFFFLLLLILLILLLLLLGGCWWLLVVVCVKQLSASTLLKHISSPSSRCIHFFNRDSKTYVQLILSAHCFAQMPLKFI